MPKNKRDSKLIDQRQQEQKKLIVDQLRKIPIIQVACEKNGVARATYYRWVDEDVTFASETEEAIREGTAFINDMAESQLITLIKDQNYPAIAFWLRNRHKAYADKLRIDAAVTVKPPEMSPEATALTTDFMQMLATHKATLIQSPISYAETTARPESESDSVGSDDPAHADEPISPNDGGKE